MRTSAVIFGVWAWVCLVPLAAAGEGPGGTPGSSDTADNADTGKEPSEGDTPGDGGESVFAVEPITVRGARESRDLSRDRAASGSVLLPEDFDDAGDTLPDVLDRQAGVRVTKLGGPASFATLSIRGSTSDQVLVVLDGMALNSAAGGPVDLSRLPLGNIGRIELYRGASPLPFGVSAIGGTLSLTTRTAHERQLVLSGGGGSFGSREARVFYAEPQDAWDLTLGLDYGGWDGAFSYVNDNGTRFDDADDQWVTRRNDHFNQVNLLGKARLHAGRQWTFTLMEWFFWRDQGVPGPGPFETEKSQYEVMDSLSVFCAKGEDLAGMAELTVQAGFRYARSAFDDPLDEIGLTGDDARDATYAPALSSSLTLTPFSWWDVTAQAAYRYERFEPSAQSTSVAQSDRHTVSAGLETGFRIEAADLLLLPSGRMEWAGSHLVHKEAATGGALRTAEADQTEWSWRFALVNTSIPDTKLTVSGGRAVRFPSLFELFGNSGRVMGNPALASESAYNVDGGVIFDAGMLPSPYRLRLEAYGFFSDVTNLIQFVQTAQNTARAENIDHARLGGVELGVRSDLLGHLRLNGNYTFLSAVNIGGMKARHGNDLPLRPASKWYARAEGYAEEIPTLKELAVFVDAEWVAGNFLDNANLVSVSDRFYLNAGVSIELKHSLASLSLTADNLTNERTADLTGYPLPGRSVHFLFTLKVL